MSPALQQKLHIIRSNKPLLAKKYHVTKIGIFGSYARGEQRSDSDIDILIETEGPFGLFALFKLEEELEKLLKVKVDLGLELKPAIRESVMNEIVYA